MLRHALLGMLTYALYAALPALLFLALHSPQRVTKGLLTYLFNTHTTMAEEFRNLVLELRQEFQRQRAHNSKAIDEQGAFTRKEISFLKRELKRLKIELLAWFIGLLMMQGILLVLVIQALNSIAS